VTTATAVAATPMRHRAYFSAMRNDDAIVRIASGLTKKFLCNGNSRQKAQVFFFIFAGFFRMAEH
jgi:hypothetical protein